MHLILVRFIFSTLTFQLAFGLTPSDGYNIGVVVGSIVGALVAIGIAVFIFYMFCIRRATGVGEPPELGYSRQNDYNLKKQVVSGPSRPGYGKQGKAPPFFGGGGGGGNVPREIGLRQGAANDVYQDDERARQRQDYALGSGGRYPSGDSGGGAAVVLSGGGLEHQARQSPNMSYSSESEMRQAGGAGRAGYGVTGVTGGRVYQERTYTTHTTSVGGHHGGGSPVSAAYLGTGV